MKKFIELAPTPEGIPAAVGFEMAMRQVIDHYMEQGLTVSDAVGCLALQQQEIGLSYLVKTGTLDRMQKA